MKDYQAHTNLTFEEVEGGHRYPWLSGEDEGRVTVMRPLNNGSVDVVAGRRCSVVRMNGVGTSELQSDSVVLLHCDSGTDGAADWEIGLHIIGSGCLLSGIFEYVAKRADIVSWMVYLGRRSRGWCGDEYLGGSRGVRLLGRGGQSRVNVYTDFERCTEEGEISLYSGILVNEWTEGR
ncbi:hypothetical protein Tco_1368691 [Tanacetum coccineum]